MITPQSIANILYRDCQAFGIEEIYPVFEGGNGDGNDIPLIDPETGLQAERIVIYVKEQQPGTRWRKNFNEVNLQVPRIHNQANRLRLEELERKAMEIMDNVVGSFDNTYYRYSIFSIGTEVDTALKCSYVNVKILFEVLNVK